MISIDLPLTTDRLILREIAHADTFAFAKIATHPRMLKKIIVKGEERNIPAYMSFVDGPDVFINMSISSQHATPRTIYSLAIIEKTSNKVIGNIEASTNDIGDTELGFCIHPDFQKKGYAAEATEAMCSYLFQRGVQAITATTRGDNKASQALLKSLGMKLIGYKPTGYSDGMPIREYWMIERIPFLVAHNTAKQKTTAKAAV